MRNSMANTDERRQKGFSKMIREKEKNIAKKRD